MIGSDVRFALRSLARQKSATALVVCMLSPEYLHSAGTSRRAAQRACGTPSLAWWRT